MGTGKRHDEKFAGWARRGQGYFRHLRNWRRGFGCLHMADAELAAELRRLDNGEPAVPFGGVFARACEEVGPGLCFPYWRRIVAMNTVVS
jgi:hypothetical protein